MVLSTIVVFVNATNRTDSNLGDSETFAVEIRVNPCFINHIRVHVQANPMTHTHTHTSARSRLHLGAVALHSTDVSVVGQAALAIKDTLLRPCKFDSLCLCLFQHPPCGAILENSILLLCAEVGNLL